MKHRKNEERNGGRNMERSKTPSSLLATISTSLMGLACLSSPSAQAIEVLPNSASSMNGVVIGNVTPQPVTAPGDSFTVNLYLSCFGRNLRSVPNPMLSNVPVDARLTVGGVTQNLRFSPPRAGQERFRTMSWTSVRTHAIDSSGNISTTVTGSLTNLSGRSVNARFSQAGYRQLSGNIRTRRSANGDVVNIHASFPGEAGYCGGYYSPLMLFFDESKPEFSAVTDFPLNPSGLPSYWPEAKSPGYFLALDKDQDGQITSGNELFGNNLDPENNGFKALAKLDSNNDGVINSLDEEFFSLLLWKDKNADGVSQPEELSKLASHKVEFLSLRYNDKHYQGFGSRAEFRERAVFAYRDSTGRQKTGELIDVWFSASETTSAPALANLQP